MFTPEHYLEVRDFLLPYQEIWKNEIMLSYPTPLINIPNLWIEELKDLQFPQDYLHLERKEFTHFHFSNELNRFFYDCLHFGSIPSWQEESNLLEESLSSHMTPKKRHEISFLYSFLKRKKQDFQFQTLLELGGGQGHLAHILTHELDCEVYSLDCDRELQRRGAERESKKWPLSQRRVKYLTTFIDSQTHFQKFAPSLDLTIGLHNCGGLSVVQLGQSMKENISALNVPCCYHKLNLQEVNLSSLAKEFPLPWNVYALTLASRAHHKFELADVILKEKVKHYRYLMHFLLYDKLNLKSKMTLGKGPRSLYDGPFSEYAFFYLEKLKIKHHLTSDELESFSHSPKEGKLIREMILAGFIRDSLGKPLEKALLLDRIFWAREKGFKSDLFSLFNQSISPRHVALWIEKHQLP
jgi:hypothetical protein